MRTRVTRWVMAALIAAMLSAGLLLPAPAHTTYGTNPTPTPTQGHRNGGDPGGSGGHGGG